MSLAHRMIVSARLPELHNPDQTPPQSRTNSREWNGFLLELRDCMAKHQEQVEQLLNRQALQHQTPAVPVAPVAHELNRLILQPETTFEKTLAPHAGDENSKETDLMDAETILDDADNAIPVCDDSEANKEVTKQDTRTDAHVDVHAQIVRLTAQSKQEPEHPNICFRLVTNAAFDMLTAAVIMFNCITIAWDVEHLTSNTESLLAISVLSEFFSAYFLLELILRLSAYKMAYFTSEARAWNLFDLALVILSLVDTGFNLFAGGAQSMGNVSSILKTLKMFRIIRVFRMIRFLRQLSDLATMIMRSLIDVVWALILLLLIIYVFAVSITFQCSSFLKQHADLEQPNWYELLEENTRPGVKETFLFFGSLPRAVASLIQAMLNGISWNELVDALMHVDGVSVALLYVYVIFAHLAVLNVVTGVFIDNALENKKAQREYKIEQKLDQAADFERDVKTFFLALDTDNTGSVSLDELNVAVRNPVLSAYFEALGFNTDDAERMFKLLDDDDSGEIALEEFLEGCQKMKGQATAVDLFKVMSMTRRLSQQIQTFQEKQLNELQTLHDAVSSLCSTWPGAGIR